LVHDPTSKYDNQIRVVGLKTKFDLDPEPGGTLEEVTLQETGKWWIYTYIRPDAHLLLGRIDLPNSRILKVEKKAMVHILPEHCPFKPMQNSKFFQLILENLYKFDFGTYLISYRTKDSYLSIRENVKSQTTQLSAQSPTLSELKYPTQPLLPLQSPYLQPQQPQQPQILPDLKATPTLKSLPALTSLPELSLIPQSSPSPSPSPSLSSLPPLQPPSLPPLQLQPKFQPETSSQAAIETPQPQSLPQLQSPQQSPSQPPSRSQTPQPQLSEIQPQGDFDLHQMIRQSGVLDMSTFPYIPKQWDSQRSQTLIPFTFPPSKATKPINPQYCHTFVKNKKCTKADCPYVHLLEDEIGPKAKEQHQKEGKKKKNKKKNQGQKSKKQKE